MGRLGRATWTVHFIFALQTNWEWNKCTTTLEKLRAYCPNIYTVVYLFPEFNLMSCREFFIWSHVMFLSCTIWAASLKCDVCLLVCFQFLGCISSHIAVIYFRATSGLSIIIRSFEDWKHFQSCLSIYHQWMWSKSDKVQIIQEDHKYLKKYQNFSKEKYFWTEIELCKRIEKLLCQTWNLCIGKSLTTMYLSITYMYI